MDPIEVLLKSWITIVRWLARSAGSIGESNRDDSARVDVARSLTELC